MLNRGVNDKKKILKMTGNYNLISLAFKKKKKKKIKSKRNVHTF